jgi:hypothetical protein
MADIIIEKIYKQPVFTWGTMMNATTNYTRESYIKALKSADASDYSLLLTFARSLIFSWYKLSVDTKLHSA